MKRIVLLFGVVMVAGSIGLAAQAPVRACSLMSKEDVKKHLPWPALLDQFPVEEEAMGTTGSACEYPSVRVQVIPFSQGTLETMQKTPGIETIRGIGDVAYLNNNRNRYAELYVRVGSRVLTLQANIKESIDDVKPGVLAMARELVAKLR